jgi:hypothetical protein
VAKDFSARRNDNKRSAVQLDKRVGHDLEINASFAYERRKAPICSTGVPVYPASPHHVTTTTTELTWYPQRTISF